MKKTKRILAVVLSGALVAGCFSGSAFAESEYTGDADGADEKAEIIDDTYGLYGGNDGADTLNDPDIAGASVGWDAVALSASGDSGLWWIDDYYVSESSKYDVTKTDDFSLKYQVEFHASEDLDAGAVEIVMDASLGTYRNGNNIIPTDIGVPYGTAGNYTASTSSPFNYYYLDASGNVLTAAQAKTASGVRIVLWNYREIISGSNAMVQVLYKELDVMQIPDMTKWSLAVSASVNLTVDGDETTESVNGNTLSGAVDTEVLLSSVTKSAYTATNKSYTPELYTESQVNSFINGSVPEPYASSFDDYIYIVWSVTFKGTATQAYEISISDLTSAAGIGGSVVGYKVQSTTKTPSAATLSYTYNSDGTLSLSSSTAKTFAATVYVVTAYDAATYSEGDEIDNTVTVTAHPQDGKDADITKTADASTQWFHYNWIYQGFTIGIKKTPATSTKSAYLDLYRINRENGKDTGAFSYSTKSTDRGFAFTHNIDSETGTLGEYISGTYYRTTTVDDVLYLYPNSGSDGVMLDQNDYYFSYVSIRTQDDGYDVWEDETAAGETAADVDMDLYVYAMFADSPDEWEFVGKTAWNAASDSATYTFSADELAREPYRVKAVHDSINYASYTTISVDVTLRADSPVMTDLISEYGNSLTSVSLENLSGVAGQAFGQNARPGTVYVNDEEYSDGKYYQDTSIENGNYSESGLAEFTEELYGTILMRDNGTYFLNELTPSADANKQVTTSNDAANSRVLADYYITAYEGYLVDDSSAVSAFKEAGIYLPERHEVTFYDLLPYGMKYNASVTATAGRITNMNSSGTWMSNTGAWSANDVTVTVSDSDIIDNWNDTGRTLVAFHITYDGDDASEYYSKDGLWYEGFGIHFEAYYDWQDMGIVDAERNIAAYVVENVTKESEQLLGAHDGEVWKDDGSVDLSAMGSEYEPFSGVSDLNNDGMTDLYTNMYASVQTTTDVATASNDNISKSVRADADVFAEYGQKAVVANGSGYTYEISLKNNTGAELSDIVIFDRLENSVEDGRNKIETSASSVFYGLSDDDVANHWTGTYTGITLTALTDLGVTPTVYYNTKQDAPMSSEDGETEPKDVLTAANGWYEESAFLMDGHSLSEVRAVAVDCGGLVLEQESGFSFQIHMMAPDGSDYAYAFNNPAYYSVSTDVTGDVTNATDIGDTVRVELGEAGTLTVEKEFDSDSKTPDSMSNAKFTFVLMRDGSVLANQEYTLYSYNEGSDNWVSTGLVSATDIDGKFSLRAGQKAVFDNIANVESVTVTEVSDVFWEETLDERTDSGTDAEYLFENKYRSPVYLYKTALTTDLASADELAEAEFTFQITVNGEPYVGKILYVDKARTDGSSPTILGYGETDADGCVTIGVNDIIAFFPEDTDGNAVDVDFEVTEINYGEDWVNFDDTVSGTTADTGVKATVENYYKYRNLILTKSLNDYDDESLCADEWTFSLTDPEGNAMSGLHWYMIDAKGDAVSGIEGYLDEDGCFSFTGAGSGRRIVIEGLVEGESYILTETDWNETLYETVNGGSVTTTMPIYSVSKSVSITNEYLLRDIEVEKIVLSEDGTGTDVDFEFTITKNGEPLANATYTVGDTTYQTDESGTFTLKGGESAYFNDIGYDGDIIAVSETVNDDYRQVYPSGGSDNQQTLDKDAVKALFINGDFDDVVSITKELEGLDDVGDAYIEIEKEDNQSVTIGSSTVHVDAAAAAIYSADDNSLTFYGIVGDVPAVGDKYKGKTVSAVYTGFEDSAYANQSSVPWYDYHSSITSVEIDKSFSSVKPSSMAYWFYSFTKASFTGLENIDTSDVTSMKYTFYSCYSLKDIDDIHGWDVSNVTTMADMFYLCFDIDAVDLSGWDTGNVTDMAYMFYSIDDMASANLSGWDVSKVENMKHMFGYCGDYLEILDLSGWDTRSVENMSYMFEYCEHLKTVYVDSDQFNTGGVMNSSYMFSGCTSIIGGNGTTYDKSNVDATYARVDAAGSPGYFTDIADKPATFSVRTLMSRAASAAVNAGESVVNMLSDMLSGDEYDIDTLSVEEVNESGIYAVDITIGIYDGGEIVAPNGTLADYEGSGEYVLIYITDDGEVAMYDYNGGEITMTLYPYDHIYVCGVSDGKTVHVAEKDVTVIYEVTAGTKAVIGADYIISNGITVNGEAASDESITLINGIGSAHDASSIYKVVSSGSSEVPAGSKVTFRVERYNGSTWEPADGVKYITMTGDGTATSGVLETGTDGKITLTKDEEGYPYIRFTEDEVKANVYTGMSVGDLRIVEVSADSEWGSLLGYDGDGWVGGPSLDITEADTFVNANDETATFEVEKVNEDGDADDEFTFRLVRILAADTPITGLSDVLDSEAGADVYYVVYDKETGRQVSDGYTDGNGNFTLKGGQYAVFYVPAGSQWLVYEGMTTGYYLANVEETAGADNGFIVDETVGCVSGESEIYATAKIVLTLSDEDGNPIAGATFVLEKDGTVDESVTYTTDFKGRITVSGLTDGTYRLKETATADGYSLPDDPYSETVMIEGPKTPETFEITMENEGQVIAFAVYSEDDYSLTFYAKGTVPTEGGTYNGKTATEVYTEFENETWTGTSDISWYSHRNDVKSVVIDSSFIRVQPTSTAYWFYNFKYADFTGFENINTSSVENMSFMFFSCTALTSLDVSGWDTGNVTDMWCTFSCCTALTDLDVSGWNTGNVTNMQAMFDTCTALTSLDVSGWNTGNVTNMRAMFYWCTALTSLDLSGWNTGNVTTMNQMFYACNVLTELDVSGWDTGNVTNMCEMFSGCNVLTELDVSGWDTGNVTNMQSMFARCYALTTIYSDDSVFVTTSVMSSMSMFWECSNLVGGAGTTYDSSNVDATYAHVDVAGNPGYFTQK